MAALAPFIPIIQQGFSALIDRIWPDPVAMATQRATALQHAQDIQADLTKSYLAAAAASDAGQAPVNLAEAQSPSFWKSGARPAIIWVTAAALFSDFVVRPYVVAFAHTPMPALDWSVLMTVMCGVLGIGAYRTVEKVKGVA